LAVREDLRVFVLSSGEKEHLDRCLGSVCEKLTLVAENGFFVRRPGRQWELLDPHISMEWMEKVRHVMELSRKCTPGSRIEARAASITWDYSACDEEYSQFKAKELIHQLSLSVANLPCRVCQGEKLVEVSSLQVGLGLFVRMHILAKEQFSEVVCIGDDPVNETIFTDAPEGALTVRVGRGDSLARHYLGDRAAVHRFLTQVVESHALLLGDAFKSIDNRWNRSPLPSEDPLFELPEVET